MDTLNLAKYVHYFILIICSIRWDTAGRYFPKVRHQLRATPDTHLLMDQAFVLVKWSFIRIVIKYLNMNIWNISFQGSPSKTSETIKSYFLYTFAFLTVGKLKVKSDHENSSKLVILRSLPSLFGLQCSAQFIMAIEIIHQLYCPAQIILEGA